MRINFKRASFMGFMITLAMMILVGFTPLKVSAAPKLNKKQIELKLGKTYKLKVKGTSNKVKWSTSNKKIAKVSKKGVVTAKKVGKTIVKAKVGKKTLKCVVNVICNKHQFEEKIIREATRKKSGEKCKVCKVCGFETEHEEIPRIKSDDEDEEESDTEDDSNNDSSGYTNPATEGLTESEVKNKLAELKKKYPDGTKVGICSAYTSLIAQELYGVMSFPIAKHQDLSKLKAGDIIIYTWGNDDDSAGHAVVVTNVNNNYIYVTDANHGDDLKCYWDTEDSPSLIIKDGKLCYADDRASIASIEIQSYYNN